VKNVTKNLKLIVKIAKLTRCAFKDMFVYLRIICNRKRTQQVC